MTVGQQSVVVPFIQFSKADATAMMTTIPGYGSTTRCCYLSASSELSLTNQDQAAVKVVTTSYVVAIQDTIPRLFGLRVNQTKALPMLKQ